MADLLSEEAAPAGRVVVPQTAEIYPLFPPGPDWAPALDAVPALVDADAMCRARGDGSAARLVVADEEGVFGREEAAIDLVGAAAIAFRCATCAPILVLCLRAARSFCAVEVDVVDGDEKFYSLHFSNRRTLVKVEHGRAEIPMLFSAGGLSLAAAGAGLAPSSTGGDLAVDDADWASSSTNVGRRDDAHKQHGSAASSPLDQQQQHAWQYVRIDLRDVVLKAFGADYFSTIQVTVHAACRVLRAYVADRAYADAELPEYLRVVRGI